MSEYLKQRQNLKLYGKPPAEKKVYEIPKKSAKKQAQEKGDNTLGEWFEARRKDLVGVCQCGCGEPSQKNDDTFFRHCVAHVFPKRLFPSVALHPLNFVERAFWGGCHSNMDDKSMSLWPNMADWHDIQAKFRVLAPLLTPEERASKFYSQLEKLVNEN